MSLSNKKRRVPEEDDINSTAPANKRQKINKSRSYCKFRCRRTICPGTTPNGHSFDTCCRTCAQAKGKKKAIYKHDNHCNKRLTQDHTFKLLAVKHRFTEHHGGSMTSTKYLCLITDHHQNEYYYRIWFGVDYNSYILIHPMKYINNKETAIKYIEAFEYDKNIPNGEASTFSHKILTDKNKAKIIESITQLKVFSSVSEFIQHQRPKTVNPHLHNNIFIDGNAVLDGISFIHHQLRYKDTLNIDYVSKEAYDSFPFSDIETTPSLILSNCSGDTTFTAKYEQFKQFNRWLNDNNIDIIPESWDSHNLIDLQHDIVQENIYYNKLMEIFECQHKKKLFDELHTLVEWNESKQVPFYNAIKDVWTDCSHDIINIILKMITPILNADDLKQRRLQFWTEKNKQIENDIGKEECDTLRRETLEKL